MDYFLQLVISGIATGCLYALIALGFVVVYKATEILNFAHGEIMMLAAYTSYSLILSLHVSFLFACLVTIIVFGFFCMVIERIIIRPMIGEPLFTVVMITIGVSIFLRSMSGITFGHDNLVFPSPFSDEKIRYGEIIISYLNIYTIGFTMVFVVLFYLFFNRTKFGLAMRATADNHDAALIMGISVKRIFSLTWGSTGIIAGVAGIFVANVMCINNGFGLVAIKAFPAIVLGGMESFPGAIIGGLAIGVIENLVSGYLDEIMGGGVNEIATYVVLFLVLIIRPYGLFGKKEIERV
ncbi:MAG: branched-chain amino acid ABC transporter permease [Thermodesulfobacteriota bacterium]|nr:branched-chain amino acid ABC transporter permease [Thermodesulfobacteriota bacterium]